MSTTLANIRSTKSRDKALELINSTLVSGIKIIPYQFFDYGLKRYLEKLIDEKRLPAEEAKPVIEALFNE